MTATVLDWAALSSAALAARVTDATVAVLPLGATEQHGAHLPLSTDTDLADGLFEVAVRRLDTELTLLRLPTLAVGASDEHAGFPGTLSVSAETLAATLRSIGAGVAAAGVRRLVFLCAHGGNRAAMDIAALDLRRAHGLLAVKLHYPRLDIGPVDLPGNELAQGIHGGAVETAMMQYLYPERVVTAGVPDEDAPVPGAAAFRRGARVAPAGEAPFAWLAEDLGGDGIAGDPRLATPALGEHLVTAYGQSIAGVLADTARLEWPPDTGT